MATCEYEQLRRKNLEDNRRILAELGLSNPFKLLPKVIKKGIKRPSDNDSYEPKKKRSKVVPSPVDLDSTGSIRGSRRLSARLRGQDPGTECIAEDDTVADEHEKSRVKYVMPDRPQWYGEVAGVDVGTIWATRMECCHDGVHRPPVAGIHGGSDGAFSLALSGGYEDDIDLGDCFTYTGEGGRDLKGTKNNPKNLRTAAQSKDQDLTRGNLALSRSVETGNPVRVIRGYKLRSPFAPEEGYRYDGLYTVEKFWFTKGMSGFGVYKFALQRCPGQAPPPWTLENDPTSPSKSSDSGFSDTVKSEAGENEATSPSDEKKSDGDKDSETKADSCSPLADNMKKDDDGNDGADANSDVDSKDVSDDNDEESSSVKHDAFESNCTAVSEKAESSASVSESAESSASVSENAESSVSVSENAESSASVSENAESSVSVSENAESSVSVSENAESSVSVSENAESSVSVSENAESSGDDGESGVASGDNIKKADEDCSSA